MEKVSSYGIGCGSVLVLAGVVQLIGLMFGWGDSNRAIFQILKIAGELVGSQALGAVLYILVGALLVALGWGLPGLLRGDQRETGNTDRRATQIPQQPANWEQSKAERYLGFVEANLLRSGFETLPLALGSKTFYKRNGGRSGETFFVLGQMNGPLTPGQVEKISKKTFEEISKRKQANSLYCYTVIVTESAPPDVQKFLRSYSPKHMAQFEFPVVVDLTSKSLYYYTGTPLWGGLMFKAIRDDANSLLRFPKA